MKLKHRFLFEFLVFCVCAVMVMMFVMMVYRQFWAVSSGAVLLGLGLIAWMLLKAIQRSMLESLGVNDTQEPPRRKLLGAVLAKSLGWLRWIVEKKSQEHVDLLIADLNRDKKAMIAKRLNPWFIRLCLWWKALLAFANYHECAYGPPRTGGSDSEDNWQEVTS